MSSERAFLATTALLFVVSAAGTIVLCRSMSGGMAMAGGWTMSMAWMRMPAQTWLGAAAMFMLMWVTMMVAMMLPSLAPILRHRRERRWLVAAAYFFIWTMFGVAAYAVGMALTAAEMRVQGLARAVPAATASVLLLAGLVQITPWKAQHLACCRVMATPMAPSIRGAWKEGIRLGVHCILCCSGLIAVLLVLGVMNLAVMVFVSAAITIERLAPRPEIVARAIGIAVIAAGAIVAFV
jgi:predicted metal-binding membrane protein